MKTTIEQESPTRLRLLVEVEPEELRPLYERTLKRLAGEVSIPGFRRGKVPRAVLESRMGREAVRQEVLRDALPALYVKAAEAESVKPLNLPDFEVTGYEDGQPLTFTATVEVRPEFTLPEYRGIAVERTASAATDEEVEGQLKMLSERFGTLEMVSRNAGPGDYVTINLQAYRHDQKIEEASAENLLYEVGSGSLVPELDAELEGKRAGDIFKFNAVLPERAGPLGGQEVSFTVVVKDVQAKRLPPIDDDFAKTASEFDTLDELKEDLRARIEAVKAAQAEAEVRVKVLEDLVDRCDLPLPGSMVESETGARLNRFAEELERRGLTLEKYLEATNATKEDLVAAHRSAAEKAVAAELVLEAVAEVEGLKVEKSEIEEEIEAISSQAGVEADKLRADLEESGRVEMLAGDILRRKTLDLLVGQANITEVLESSSSKE